MAETNRDPRLMRQLMGHHKAVNCVDFSPNLKQIGGEDNFILVWPTQEEKRTFRYSGHKNHVTWVRFSPSGEMMASASLDHSVRVWKPNIRGENIEIKTHSAAVRCVEFANDGDQLVTGSDDKTVKVWDIQKNRFLQSFVGHRNWVRCVSVASDDTLLASASDDTTVKLWDKKSSKCVHSFEGPFGEAHSVAFRPSNDCVAASFKDGSVRLWDIRTHQLVQLYEQCNASSTSFHPSGNYLLNGGRILDLREGRVIYSLVTDSFIRNANFSPNGEMFACCSDKLILLYKIKLFSMDKKSKTAIKNETKDMTTTVVADSAANAVTCASNSNVKDKQIVSQTKQEEEEPETALAIGGKKSQNREESDLRLVKAIERRSSHLETEDRLKTTEMVVHQLTSQIDVLVQTVSFMEERLNQMEDRFDQILTLNQELLRNCLPRNDSK